MPALSTHHLQLRRLGRRRGAAFALALLAAALVLTLSRYATGPAASPPASPSYGHRLPALVDITLVYGATDKGAGFFSFLPSLPPAHFKLNPILNPQLRC
jgi:hypothetical protein